MAKKITLHKGPASAHEGPGELIREFSDGQGNGGLLSLRHKGEGTLLVDVYRVYGQTSVLAGVSEDDKGPQRHVFLDLIASVLPKGEMDDITAAPPRVIRFDEGAWVHVPGEDFMGDDEDWEDFPNLRAVIEYARERGARYVMLDRDGLDAIPGLPLFDW